MADLFSDYLAIAAGGEAPTTYHRWSLLSAIGTLLGRRVKLPFGAGYKYANLYIMLIGEPGTRKSTTIGLSTKMLKAAGYSKFAPDKVSKEKFLDIMMRQVQAAGDEIDLLAELEELEKKETVSDIMVAADEFNDFVGTNNAEFLLMLGKLWDCPSEYIHPKFNGVDVHVPSPTVNILSGNTHDGLLKSFPPEAVGLGFLSRILFIYAKSTGRKITFPPVIRPETLKPITDKMKQIAELEGEVVITPPARKLLDEIYKGCIEIPDYRFKHYQSRRLDHLLKMVIIMAAADLRLEVLPEDVKRANSMLYHAERRMPLALGEYGKSKNAEVTNLVLDVLDSAHEPMTAAAIWKKVSESLKNQRELGDIIMNLLESGKVQSVKHKGHTCLLRVKEAMEGWPEHLLDEDFITTEEKL